MKSLAAGLLGRSMIAATYDEQRQASTAVGQNREAECGQGQNNDGEDELEDPDAHEPGRKGHHMSSIVRHLDCCSGDLTFQSQWWWGRPSRCEGPEEYECREIGNEMK